MSDKSTFTAEEWHALVDAPLCISLAMTAVGSHGPISMMKESAATARSMLQPRDHGAANGLIAEIAAEAKGKEARQDAKHHSATTIPVLVDTLLVDLEPAKAALAKLPADEAQGVRDWFVDIAHAVAEAAKGVKPEEQSVIDRLQALLDA